MTLRKGCCAVGSSIDDGEVRRPLPQQWMQNATNRTASTNDQRSTTLKLPTEVGYHVPDQPHTIGVVGMKPRFPRYQAIGCTRSRGSGTGCL